MARNPLPGTFAYWLKHARKARFPERQADARAELKRLTGVSISSSEWAQWESGSREPRADNPKRKALYDFFGGSEVADAEQLPPSDLAAVVRSLDNCADAMSALASAIEKDRAERVDPAEWLKGFLSGLPEVLAQAVARAVAQQADPADTPPADARPVPRGR